MEKFVLTILISFFAYAMVSADVMMFFDEDKADESGAADNSEALSVGHDAGSMVSVTSDDTCSGKVSAFATPVILEYYSTQGIITDPGKYAYLYEGLPCDVEKLVEIVQGLMIHIAHAHRYGVEPSEERAKEIFIRKVEDMLGRIIELDSRPITQVRNPEKRFVGNCRHYAVFICSLLRHKGIPSRARCGFATYFPSLGGLTHEDHWICEYWNSSERRWVQIDAQVDSLLKKAFQFKFNALDLPNGRFLVDFFQPAGEVWKLCRSGKLDPNRCGFETMKGFWFIGENAVRDFMSLNKLEVLPWDSSEFMKGYFNRLPNSEECALLDKVAEITTAGNNSFSEVRSLYESNSALRMPADWEP